MRVIVEGDPDEIVAHADDGEKAVRAAVRTAHAHAEDGAEPVFHALREAGAQAQMIYGDQMARLLADIQKVIDREEG